VWAPTYRAVYWDLYDQMYANGTANALLDEIAATVPISDGLDEQALLSAVDTVREWIAVRVVSLDTARTDA
jgi:spore coat protein CotH